MTPLVEKIRQRILAHGPILFSDFMQMALYDPVHGYYRGDPFGRDGDFYTAAQLQPVFGAYVRQLAERHLPGFANFVDVGAGREDLREAFPDKHYFAVQAGQRIPKTQNTLLFANEFFDALPVDVECHGQYLRVAVEGENFVWWPVAPDSQAREHCPALPGALQELFDATASPAVLIAIDYGYTAEELPKFPRGTLLAYRSHIAHENVLAQPGQQDLTAHVDWDAFFTAAQAAGWRRLSWQRLDHSLMSFGESALTQWHSLDPGQLKQLLFSLGPRFDVAVLGK